MENVPRVPERQTALTWSHRARLIVVAGLTACWLMLGLGDAAARARKPPRSPETAVVKRAVDGDTLELVDGRKVRLLGIDAPEVHHPKKHVEAFGVAAHDFASKHIAGQPVRLEFDSRQGDKYGRVLAYVFRTSDGLFLNREIVAQGYAHVESRWPFRYLEEFRELERNARTAGVGLWGQ